jgi:acyl-coenzyme A thioesterase PaaI-like protein
VTGEISIRFRQPVPLGVELTAVGRIIEEKKRTFKGTGELLLPDGTVAAEGSGTYIKMEITRIAAFDPEVEEWGVRPD